MLRSLVFLAAAIFVSALVPVTASAQQPAADPAAPAAGQQTPPRVNSSTCANLEFGKTISQEEVTFLKLCQETLGLQTEVARKQAEIDNIKASTNNGMFTALVSLGPLFGALVALISAGVGYAMKSNTENRLMLVQQEHERATRRENRTMRMLDELSGSEPARQSFAAAGLFSLVREVMDDHRMPASDRGREASMLVTAMLARLRDPALRPAEVKYIADGLYRLFMGDGKKKGAMPFALKDFNLQQVRLAKAYLADLDAAHADFFEADLSEVSFRRANLQNAIFRNALMPKTVLAGADLGGADLRGAHLEGAQLAEAKNLDKARFSAETTFDGDTTWPPGFNRAAAGLSS